MNNSAFLPPWMLQLIGVAIVIGAVIFWAATGQQSALIVGAGISLSALGAYSGLHISIKQDFSGDEEESRKNGR